MAKPRKTTPPATSRAASLRAAEFPPAGAAPAAWTLIILGHHEQIRRAFARAAVAPAGGSRSSALKGLALLLTGHSLAEEAVLYPVLANAASAPDAEALYHEQALAKVQMAALEMIDPADAAWISALEEIRDAVEVHMREEEESLFPRIAALDVSHARITARYLEEFERYTRTGAVATNACWTAPPRAAVD
jgi:hemerythrin superfamily protein